MQVGSTTGSNYIKAAIPAMNDVGTTTTHDRYVGLAKPHYSDQHTIQTTKRNRPGTTVSGLVSALGPTNTSLALPPVSTVLGPSDDYRPLTDTTVNYSIRSLPLPGRLTVSVEKTTTLSQGDASQLNHGFRLSSGLRFSAHPFELALLWGHDFGQIMRTKLIIQQQL